MRPRKNTPDQVADAIDKLISQYMETGDVQYLTDYAVMSLLGIASRTLDSYYDGEADKRFLDNEILSDADREKYKKSGYREAVKRLIEFRRSECVRHIAGGGASTSITGWIFLSKQPRWGGFQDIQRVEKTGTQSFCIQLSGPDGKPLNSE